MIELNDVFCARAIQKIEAALGEGVCDMLKHNNCWLAGGALTSLWSNKEVNDYDIYFSSSNGVDDVIANVYGRGVFLSQYELVATFATDRSFTTVYGGKTKVQFIWYQLFNTPDDIFDSFDYTVNMCAYSFKEKKFYAHPSFLTHLSQRYLSFNEGTDFPLISVLRARKYMDKGFTISKSELVRVILSAADVKYDSWETVISHIGSMYGIPIEDMFDQTKPFSISEVVLQLQEIDLDLVTKTPDQPTMKDVGELCVSCTDLFKEYCETDPNGYDDWHDFRHKGELTPSEMPETLDRFTFK